MRNYAYLTSRSHSSRLGVDHLHIGNLVNDLIVATDSSRPVADISFQLMVRGAFWDSNRGRSVPIFNHDGVRPTLARSQAMVVGNYKHKTIFGNWMQL
ncbi:hypothetical protein D3M70_08005 [Pseudomonas sp. LS-2]|nr:hypothetical protein D3M70_08005 [Pseudomonas sp. LS-2]